MTDAKPGTFVNVDPIYQNAGDPNLAPVQATAKKSDSDEVKAEVATFDEYVKNQEGLSATENHAGEPRTNSEEVANPTVAKYEPPQEDSEEKDDSSSKTPATPNTNK